MANSAIFDLTPETALTAAHEFVAQDTSAATRAQSATFALMGGLESTSGSDADTTMAVGKLYTVDMSAWATADRTYTLPASAQVGERIGIFVTAGDASHELIITAAASDTLNGVAGGTEWSRLFITNECVIMRCITADSAWVVEYDGRICQQAKQVVGSTDTGGVTASAWSRPNFTTTSYDIGDISDLTNDRFNVRRAGKYILSGNAEIDNTADGERAFFGASVNGAAAGGGARLGLLHFSHTSSGGGGNATHMDLSAGDNIAFEVFLVTSGGAEDYAVTTHHSISEVLR